MKCVFSVLLTLNAPEFYDATYRVINFSFICLNFVCLQYKQKTPASSCPGKQQLKSR